MAHVHPRLLLVALKLLTRLPVGQPLEQARDRAHSIRWYGIVGTVVGGVAAFAWWGTSLVLPHAAAAAVSFGLVIALTGGQHERGLADTADGFFGAVTPRDRLGIMRDDVLRVPGVLTLVLSLILRVALLAALDPVSGAAALVVVAAVGRGGLGMALLGTVSATTDATDTDLLDHLRVPDAVAAGVSAVAVAVVLLRLPGLAMVVGGLVIAFGVRAMAVRRVGGLTSEVTGAMLVLAEVAALALAVGLDVGVNRG